MSEYGLLSTKQVARLLYSMGCTFDGLRSTFMATEEFLRTGNPQVVNSKADYNLLLDLRQAASTPCTTTMLTSRLTWRT